MQTIWEFLYIFLTIYMIVIFAWVVLSWFRLGYDHPLFKLQDFLRSVVDPYLNLFRGLIKPVQVGGAMLDLSAIIGIILIVIARGFVTSQV